MEGVFYSIIGFVGCAVLGGIWALIKKKYKLKDVDATAIEEVTKKQASCRAEVDKELEAVDAEIAQVRSVAEQFDRALPPLLNGVYALLITTQQGHVNGEIGQALEEFTDTFRRDFHIKINR